jgi:DNA polymerase (family X)
LRQLACIAAIRGDAREQALFTRAEALVRSRALESDADLGALLEHPPPEADSAVLEQLRYMYESAAWVLLESALADLPFDLRWLFESGAVTLAQLAQLHDALGITSAADIRQALAEHGIRDLSEFDGSIEQAIAAALPNLRRTVSRIPLGRAVALAQPALARLRSLPSINWATPSGSLRRGSDTVGDLELVASTSRPDEAIDTLLQLPDVVRCLHRGARRLYLLLERVQLGVRLPEPASAGAVLLHATGSAAHLAALRARAASSGLTLTTTGIRSADGTVVPAATEEQIYEALGIPFIPPEIREGGDEIDAAVANTLPALLTKQDIRGDLHMHSDFSDGRDPVETMVRQCRELGYEYVAITDHSPHSAASRNLSADSILRQADEIARLRERYSDIAILHGCEVDILPDGRLDFPDRVLEGLDIVLASLHERAGQSADQLLRRYEAAMKNPLVTLITHPTNRLVPHRDGYDLDYERLFELAVETGTCVEIDGSPAHLDLDGALARRATAAGATIAVDSDCHRAELLEMQMDLGVTTARRGWVECRHVINTRPLADVRAVIDAKRRR